MDRKTGLPRQEAIQGAVQANEAVNKAGGASTMAGAAGAGLLVGGLAIGPVAALAGAAGAAYATTRGDEWGDAARATGDASAAAYAKAKELDRDHHILSRTKDALVTGYNKAVEIDQQYSILDRTKRFARDSYSKAREIDQQYDLSGKAASATISGMNSITKMMAPSEKKALAGEGKRMFSEGNK